MENKLTPSMLWLIKRLTSIKGTNGYITNEVGSRSSFKALVNRGIIKYDNGWFLDEDRLHSITTSLQNNN